MGILVTTSHTGEYHIAEGEDIFDSVGPYTIEDIESEHYDDNWGDFLIQHACGQRHSVRVQKEVFGSEVAEPNC